MLLGLVLLVFAVASQVTHCVDDDLTFCLTISNWTTTSSLVGTIQTKYTGWAAVAFGSNQMGGGVTAYVGWPGSKGATVISERKVVDTSMPAFVQDGTSAPIPQGINAQNTTGIFFSFVFPASQFPQTKSVDIIYAVASTAPSEPDSAQSSFTRHDTADTFSLSLTNSSSGADASGARPLVYSCADSQGTFCVTFDPSLSPSDNFTVATVQTYYTGWAGVAFGTRNMSGNAAAYVGWTGTNGSPVISERTVSANAMPSFVRQGTAVAIPQQAAAAMNGTGLVFSFLLPVSSFALSGRTNLIFAVANSGPSDPDLPNSTFSIHDSYGTLSVAATGADDAVDVPQAIASSSFCADARGTFCAVATRYSEYTVLTVYSVYTGWVGIGSGTGMAGSTMFVGWPSNGTVTVSQRVGTGHSEPSVAASAAFAPTDAPPGSVALPPATGVAFSIKLAQPAQGILSVARASPLIFAVSNASAQAPADPSSAFPMHSSYGLFALDVSGGPPGLGAGKTADGAALVLVHGLCMFAAWGLLAPLGIVVARYLKARQGSWHAALFCAVGLLSATGLILVEVYVSPAVSPQRLRFIGSRSAHAIIGTSVVLAVYPLQCILGCLSRSFGWLAARKAHRWIGALTVVLATANMHLGLAQYNASVVFLVLFWVWMLSVCLGGWYFGDVLVRGWLGPPLRKVFPANPQPEPQQANE
ncbi:hypothetical protein HDU83_006846 [Entophlyctis luteolus]|nr:hypothetical protein HDU83_006846 [Entophlyctis luteolus]